VSASRPRPLPVRRYWLTALAVAAALWAALFWAPVSREARMHATAETDYLKASWIYDRLHHDATPVDIAFFGSSRMLQAVDAGRVERGMNAGSGNGLHVENLSIPGLGRDSEFLIARDALAAKRPRLAVFELDYLESGDPNGGLALLASGPDLLGMPWLINRELPYDLLFVPAHNLRLLWDGLRGADAFDPLRYEGPHWNGTEFNRGRNGFVSGPRSLFPPAERLRTDSAWWADNLRRKAAEYDSWAWLELRYNEILLRRILEATREAGARVIFLYIPPVGMTEPPFQQEMLRRYGEIWSLPADIVADHRLWLNPTHPNLFGARRISDWLADRLAEEQATGTLPAR
jgi:hypothetical protein